MLITYTLRIRIQCSHHVVVHAQAYTGCKEYTANRNVEPFSQLPPRFARFWISIRVVFNHLLALSIIDGLRPNMQLTDDNALFLLNEVRSYFQAPLALESGLAPEG